MTKKEIYRNFKFLIIVVIVTIISNWLVLNSSVAKVAIFETSSLFTYFGVLIGFALTIYTFGMSLVSNIKSNIEKSNEYTKDVKELMYSKIISAFGQIKHDIWVIFYAVVLVIFIAIVKDVENPFGWDVEEYKIPETVNVSLFFIATIGMFDIMKSLFNLSEINLHLIKKASS